MEGQLPQSPADPSQPSRSRGVAFRVCTVDDYSLQKRREDVRRRYGQVSTTACRMCRLRKIKCVEADDGNNNPQSPRGAGSSPRSSAPWRCQPCQQADLECQWNMVDKRKRRKGQLQVRQDAGTGSRPGAFAAPSAVASQEERHTRHKESQPIPNSSRDPMSHGGDENETPNREHQGASTPRSAAIQIPSFMASNFDGPFPTISGEENVVQPVFAEIFPDGTMQPQSWTDFQDCLFGLDFMQDASGNIGLAGGGGPALALTSGDTPTEPSQSNTPASRAVRLRYYRRFGPTAVVPGLRKLVLVLDPAEQEHQDAQASDLPSASLPAQTAVPTPQPLTSSPGSVSSQDSKLFDPASRKPHPEIMSHILDVFFEHFGGHFPFLHPQILGGHVRSQEASSFLLNAIAALTVRFCPADGPLALLQEKYDVQWRRGSPFLVKAKEQLVPLLSIPAPEVVDGLLILAWAEFGDNNETGMWMFAGMAIRMAQDLGLNRTPEPGVDPDINFHDQARPSPDGTYVLTDEQSTLHQQKARLAIFWSVFMLDVCVSLVTGRPPTIRRSEIEVPVPSFNDMKLLQLDFSKEVTVKNMVFPATVEFMLHFSQAVELLNQMPPNRGSEPSFTAPGLDQQESLAQARKTLEQRYSMLPIELVFNIENFKAASASYQSGVYLMLHLFFYTVLTLLSNHHSRDARHGLHYARSRRPSASNFFEAFAQHSPLDSEGSLRSKTTAFACQKIVQILSIATLVDTSSFLASPFTNHCLFVAASALLRELGLSQESAEHQSDGIFALNANADYLFLYNKLQDQATYFGGIKTAVAVLEHKHRALISAGQQINFDEEEPEDGMHRMAALDDPGIVNRYSIPGQQHV